LLRFYPRTITGYANSFLVDNKLIDREVIEVYLKMDRILELQKAFNEPGEPIDFGCAVERQDEIITLCGS